MRRFAVVFAIFSLCSVSSASPEFTFYLVREPRSLDPAKMRGSGTSYLFGNIFRGLYIYDDKKGLVPDGAKSCTWGPKQLQLTCELSARKWSDGSAVVAADYVRAFRYFVSNRARSVRAELLLNLRNAAKIFAGKLPENELGLSAPSKSRLIFHLEKPDPEFKYSLSNPLLVPLKSTVFQPPAKSYKKVIYNGPYMVKEWNPGRSIALTPNPGYPGAAQRPNARVFFIAEDSTALAMYETGRLSFLWRLPTKLVPAYRKRKDFVRVGFARFDYLGFNSEFDSLSKRKALALSLNYTDMQKLYHSEGRPGCPALPLEFVDREVCYPFSPQEAKKIFSGLPPSFQKKRFKLGLSHFGGGGNKTVAEWIQSQWKNNLEATIDIQQLEQKYFLKMVRTRPTSIFRKGVGLLRPTCSAALQTFTQGNSENYIQYKNPQFDRLVQKLRFESSPNKKKTLCRQGIELLMNDYALIPLGRMHFNFLVNPIFKGWRLNALNHLDLSQLSSQ